MSEKNIAHFQVISNCPVFLTDVWESRPNQLLPGKPHFEVKYFEIKQFQQYNSDLIDCWTRENCPLQKNTCPAQALSRSAKSLVSILVSMMMFMMKISLSRTIWTVPYRRWRKRSGQYWLLVPLPIFYPARARRALGLLLADGTPTGGRGEDFLNRQPNFFTETAVTSERKVKKSFPRWEINRHDKG